MFQIINYLYFKLTKYLRELLQCYPDKTDLCLVSQSNGVEIDQVRNDEFSKQTQINLPKQSYPYHQIRSNTSPNLITDKNLLIKSIKVNNLKEQRTKQIDWFCKTCSKQIGQYGNIYCCNDFIFCTPNCRDRFLNYFSNK